MQIIQTSNFNNIYSDMQLQFPPQELKTYEEFLEILGNNYTAYDIIDEINNKKIGYIILFETYDFIFIDYIAVFKEFQSLGYGGKILEKLKKHFSSKKGCLLEVEKPDENKQNTLRRIKFYHKHNAEKININYLYPNASGYLPMDLYYIKYQTPIQKDEIRDFITKLFKTVHFKLTHHKKVLEKIFE